MFESSQEKKEVRQEISSFFVELFVEFLPEPLILTILLDSKTDVAHHISIEKGAKTGAESSKQITNLLFGGKKGYDWMASFLGLMDTIKLKPKKTESVSGLSREVVMT